MFEVKSAVYKKLISPIYESMLNNPYSRICKVIADDEWVQMGIERIVSESKSGRGFLQKQFFKGTHEIDVGLYFEALKSERRLKFLRHLNMVLIDAPCAYVDCEDPISKLCPELDDFIINFGDGHYHNAPTHEKKVDGKTYGTQHFYAKNARNHMMWLLSLADYGEDRKKEHDMRMLKRQDMKTLKAGAKKGQRSLWIWDRACMNFAKWFEWKRYGIYFLTLEKESNKFEYMSKPKFDKNDPINFGVLKDEKVSAATSKQVLRRVTYRCPDTQKNYCFVTNLPFDIRPGTIAFLYKCRWDIEKTFNTFKHKLYEQKAWAVNDIAKTAQANFLCLTHNLALIMNRKVDKNVSEPKLSPNFIPKKRKKKRREDLIKKCKKSKTMISKLVLNVERLAEIPKKYFEWLRETLQIHCSWENAIERLERSCAMNL